MHYFGRAAVVKSFLWRLRSNAGWFLLALAIFSGLYLLLTNSEIRYSFRGFSFAHADPFLPSMLISFAFFMFYTKRYTYDEEYFYGHSRKHAFVATQCGAVVYALLFSCYAMGVALLVRRSFVAGDVIMSESLYNISALEMFFNFLSLFIVDMLVFEVADIFRKLKTWKFWAAAVAIVATLVTVCLIYVEKSLSNDFHYWKGMFLIFVPLACVAFGSDLFMTRGRQYR